MSMNASFSWAPDLTDAIDHQPLVLNSQTPLFEAIAQISQAHARQCSLVEDFSSSKVVKTQSSCALVVEQDEVLGILTERDIVRLTAKAVNFNDATVAEVMIHPVVTLPKQSIKDVFAALFLFRRYRIRHLPILDDQGKLCGVITHESIRKILRPANLLQFRRVADVMTSEVIHAPLNTSVFQLAWLMSEHRVSCVVITTAEEDRLKPVGIVTERDMVQFQSLKLNLMKTQAQDVMSSPLFLLSPEDSLWSAHQEMQKRRVGRLVVSWNWGKGLGIVTQTSLLRVFDPLEMYGVIENLQQTIAQLRQERQERMMYSEATANTSSRSTTSLDQPTVAARNTVEADNSLERTLVTRPDQNQAAMTKMLTQLHHSLEALSQNDALALADFRNQLAEMKNVINQLSQTLPYE